MALIYIKTYGCAHNMADSETMADYLARNGHEITGLDTTLRTRQDKRGMFKEMNKADLIIFNTCTVKDPSESKFFSAMDKVGKPIVIAGCIPQSQQEEEWLKRYSAIGVDQLHKIELVVEATLRGEVVHELSRKNMPYDRTFLPVTRKNKNIAIVPILQGCRGACTYCKTKSARGDLKSYPPESVVRQVRMAKTEGLKEVWLVSEDNGGYGLDIGSTLPELLEELSVIGGNLKIRVGMLNPNYVYRYKDELARILKQDVFYKFLHIPVQSGSDKVLKEMNRPYTREQFDAAIATLKREIPDITISTDIICGYPTETEDDFKQTMELIRTHQFPVLNISKFYPRAGTKAAQLKQLLTKTIKERSVKVTSYFSNLNPHEGYTGSTISATIIDYDYDHHLFLGRTNNYRQILVRSEKNILGQDVLVQVTETTRDDMRGFLN
ncbi:MAG: tRNA (N(6)-L-threonylcarbamoyladenosine(37)-C(2))-methylthiotransferase [Nanobdellota archaeon]